MLGILSFVFHYLIGVAILGALVWAIGITKIKSTESGIIEKLWSRKGSVPTGKMMALNGEAGYQPDLLRAGIKLFLSPLIYKVVKKPSITISQDEMAYVFAKDGEPLTSNQLLARAVECNNFQDVRAFLQNGGQKGIQENVLKAGTYFINLAQFTVLTRKKVYALNENDKLDVDSTYKQLLACDGFSPINIRSKDDKIGIVYTKAGQAMPAGELVAPPLEIEKTNANYHDSFQSISAFLQAGGYKGQQYNALTEGTYFINRIFADVNLIPKTEIPMGYVGVINSFYGEHGQDVSGDDFKHGKLVQENCRGIWETPLTAGKRVINTNACEIKLVPTKNTIIKWISEEYDEEHMLDQDLRDIEIITADAFKCLLPLTIVFHILPENAPKIIQQFGQIENLITQCLDPMISGYFKTSCQKKNLIDLIKNRSSVLDEAKSYMQNEFKKYSLELDEVLIGTPKALPGDKKLDDIYTQLRERQISEEKIQTFEAQKKSAEKEKEYNIAKAAAEKQTELTQSKIDIEIKENEGKADVLFAKQNLERTKAESDAALYKKQKEAEAEAYLVIQKAQAQANEIKLLSEADANKIKITGEATADMETRTGIAKAIAIEEQVKSYGGASYLLTREVVSEVAKSLENSKAAIVPNTVITSGNTDNKGVSNVFMDLITLSLSKLNDGTLVTKDKNIESLNPTVQKLKDEILNNISKDSLINMNTINSIVDPGIIKTPGMEDDTTLVNEPIENSTKDFIETLSKDTLNKKIKF